MAKSVTKLADKLTKINESYSVHRYDNGWMFEAGGRNKSGEYVGAKILCSTLDEVHALVNEAASMEIDN